MQQPQRRADDGVAVRAVPAGAPRPPGRANQARSTEISSRSSSRSSTASWPGSSLTISSASSGITGQLHSSARSVEQRRQRAQQPPAHLAVAAGRCRCSIVVAPSAVVAPACARRGRQRSLSSIPSSVTQRCPGRISACGASPAVVGDAVVVRAATDRDVPRARSAPAPRRRAAPTPRRARSRRSSAAPRPGCASTRAASSTERSMNASACAGPVEQSSYRIHETIVDARAWTRESRAMDGLTVRRFTRMT